MTLDRDPLISDYHMPADWPGLDRSSRWVIARSVLVKCDTVYMYSAVNLFISLYVLLFFLPVTWGPVPSPTGRLVEDWTGGGRGIGNPCETWLGRFLGNSGSKNQVVVVRLVVTGHVSMGLSFVGGVGGCSAGAFPGSVRSGSLLVWMGFGRL